MPFIFTPPPRDLTMQFVAWLRDEIYPGLLGESWNLEGQVAWVDDRWTSLWQTIGFDDNIPEKVQQIKNQVYREIVAVKARRDRQAQNDMRPILLAGDRAYRPLVGQLRRENKLVRDDTGYRWPFFCSWFPALRQLLVNEVEFDRQLAVVAQYYQGIRIFGFVGGWSDFWDGAEVVPPMLRFRKWRYNGNIMRADSYAHWVEPNVDESLVQRLLAKCRAAGVRVQLTHGDMQILCTDDQQRYRADKELQYHDWMSRVCAPFADVIAMVDATNERPMNRPGGNSDAGYRVEQQILDIWRRNCPGVGLLCQGSPLSEEPADLYAGSQFGDTIGMHFPRDPFSTYMKRSYGAINFDGDWRHLPAIEWADEPLGPGADSFASNNDPKKLTAAFAGHKCLGQPATYFNGPAVRGRGALESTWGFRELPTLLHRVIPEDVALWAREFNAQAKGICYWTRERDFVTYAISSQSDPAQNWNPEPPRPINSWTLYAGDDITEGRGTPPPFTGLLVGRFQ